MNLTNNIVTLSPAERAMLAMCVSPNLDAKPANEVLTAMDQKLDAWESESAIDVVNMRIIEKIRNNLAIMAKLPIRQSGTIAPHRSVLN